MPHYVIGDLWDEVHVADLILVTTNAMLNQTGELVMGRGAALEAKQRYPELPKELGRRLKDRDLYGIEVAASDGVTEIGAFQVKYHWKDEAKLELIAFSTGILTEIAWEYGRIALNFPGVGNGRLTVHKVKPFLDMLPSNIYIYTKV